MKLVAVETIKKDVCDFDRYDFEVKSPLSSKEYSVTIDFKNSEIRGDYVAYGEWNNLDIDECLEILDTLTEEEIKRDFSLIKKVVIEKRHNEIIENMIEQEKKSKEIIEKEIKKMQVVIDSIPQNLYDKLERTNSQKISIDSFMNLFTDLEFVKNGGC